MILGRIGCLGVLDLENVLSVTSLASFEVLETDTMGPTLWWTRNPIWVEVRGTYY